MKVTRTGVALLVGTGFMAGFAARTGNDLLSRAFGVPWAAAQGIATPGVAAQGPGGQDTNHLLTLFNTVLERVRADYVEPVSSTTLVDSALNGMLTGLDPHSSYLTEPQWHALQNETTGKFGGIGLQVTDNGGLLEVVSPIDGTPAAEAGLMPGDLITAVDGKSVEGLSLTDAVAEMRGPPDTMLRMTVKRQGQTKPLEFTLTRRIVHVQTVTSRLIGDLGVIRISEFTEQTNPGVHAALRRLRTESGGKLRGLILDLRNDPGGLLDQAIDVSNDFLASGGIVSTHGRHAADDASWPAKPGADIAGNLPVVVLTNNGTASAAEIVAGALQDDRRALVLGTRTFGKGSVQTLIPLGDDGALRLTTARYYLPSGRSIQGLGITPNVVVQETRTPAPHFGPQHEADLLHILSTPENSQGNDKAMSPPSADLPAAAQQIPKLPPPDWPAIDAARPETDFQLQQGLVLVRAMAAGLQSVSR
ncbi:S41 family peptidase [Rhodopila sp.]|uniref:S41 family peptidase n=1 Tax=Rhodopila sp. TaxID=2480087 RepID=UPI003D12D645